MYDRSHSSLGCWKEVWRHMSVVPRIVMKFPRLFSLRFRILQAIKNWRCRRPWNKARYVYSDTHSLMCTSQNMPYKTSTFQANLIAWKPKTSVFHTNDCWLPWGNGQHLLQWSSQSKHSWHNWTGSAVRSSGPLLGIWSMHIYTCQGFKQEVVTPKTALPRDYHTL